MKLHTRNCPSDKRSLSTPVNNIAYSYILYTEINFEKRKNKNYEKNCWRCGQYCVKIAKTNGKD